MVVRLQKLNTIHFVGHFGIKIIKKSRRSVDKTCIANSIHLFVASMSTLCITAIKSCKWKYLINIHQELYSFSRKPTAESRNGHVIVLLFVNIKSFMHFLNFIIINTYTCEHTNLENRFWTRKLIGFSKTLNFRSQCCAPEMHWSFPA